MEITSNPINRIIKTESAPAFKAVEQNAGSLVSNTNLPSVHSIGESLINTNTPVSYTKIAEIDIPGLDEKASVFKLSNGQKVVIAPKKGPTFVKTTYNVGSLNETEDIRGISHFIEHNLFNGSKDLAPKEYDKKVSDLGGYTNASTSFDKTDYYLFLQLLKDNSLEEAIRLNALQTQFPTFPADQLEKEKEPVKSEIDMYKDMPHDIAESLALKNLFNIPTDSDNAILGTKDNINSFTREKVLDYYNTWYTPDNAVTVITGDVDVNETINLVSKYFNKKPDLSKINQRHYEPLIPIDKPVRTDIIHPSATSGEIYMAFPVPEGVSNEDKDKIDALLGILSSSGSRLSKALDKYGLSADFITEKLQNKSDGAEAIVLSISPTEKQLEDVLKILYEEITFIANNPPTQQELDNIKKKTIKNLNSVSEESGYLNAVLTNLMLKNDTNYFENTKRNFQNMTPADISAAARKFLDLNKVSICVAHEKDATSESIHQNYNQTSNTAAPKTVSFGAVHNPKDNISEITNNIKMYKLWNNIETTVIPGNQYAKSCLSINFSSDELNSFSSPAFQILNEMLTRGSLYKDVHTFNDHTNSKDISLDFSCDIDGLKVNAVFDDENLQDTMALIREGITAPNLTQQEFDRAKELIKDSILSETPSAYDNLFSAIYPDIRIYDSQEQRLQALESLTLDDIRNLYNTILSTASAKASITLPVNEKPHLKDIFHNELSQSMPVVKPFTKQKSDSYRIYKPNTQAQTFVKASEQAQADIVQAYTYKRVENIDDIAKIRLMNIILGQGMSSRLFTDLREDKKLAYSVSSGLGGEKEIGTITLSIGTTTDSPIPNEGSPENAKLALEGFQRNVDLLKTEPVSSKELEDAKIMLKSTILNNIETNMDKTASYSATSDTYYDIRYYEELLDAIDRVSVEDIKCAANYVFANQPVTSIVASQKTLEALNLK